MSPLAPAEGRGLQTLDRAMSVLRALVSAGDEGLRMADVQALTGLPKPTVHRLLLAMIENGLVHRDAQAPRYRLGQELVVLAWSALNRESELYSEAAHSAIVLARETGDTVFVLARSGFDTVCIGWEFGHFPIKALMMEKGERRPLGFGVSSLAILGAMPAEEALQVLRHNQNALRRSGLSAAAFQRVRKESELARSRGYAFAVGLFHESVAGVAKAVRNPHGAAQLSLVIAAIESRIPPHRAKLLGALLERECERIEQLISRGSLYGQAV